MGKKCLTHVGTEGLDDRDEELIALEKLLKKKQLELEILKLEHQIKQGKAQLEE